VRKGPEKGENLRLSESELSDLLAKNPHLKTQGVRAGKRKPQKYRNTKVCAGGIVFDSVKEYERWLSLCALEKAGVVTELKRQEKLVIAEAFRYKNETVREICYVFDFVYTENGKTVVEDVKPFDTASGKYRLTKDFALNMETVEKKIRGIRFPPVLITYGDTRRTLYVHLRYDKIWREHE
jgi:hypothetical protein